MLPDEMWWLAISHPYFPSQVKKPPAIPTLHLLEDPGPSLHFPLYWTFSFPLTVMLNSVLSQAQKKKSNPFCSSPLPTILLLLQISMHQLFLSFTYKSIHDTVLGKHCPILGKTQVSDLTSQQHLNGWPLTWHLVPITALAPSSSTSGCWAGSFWTSA